MLETKSYHIGQSTKNGVSEVAIVKLIIDLLLRCFGNPEEGDPKIARRFDSKMTLGIGLGHWALT